MDRGLAQPVLIIFFSLAGGIWANVNATSGLQLNSLLYRFFPGVLWKREFPHRDEILGGMRALLNLNLFHD